MQITCKWYGSHPQKLPCQKVWKWPNFFCNRMVIINFKLILGLHLIKVTSMLKDHIINLEGVIICSTDRLFPHHYALVCMWIFKVIRQNRKTAIKSLIFVRFTQTLHQTASFHKWHSKQIQEAPFLTLIMKFQHQGHVKVKWRSNMKNGRNALWGGQ